MSSKDLKIRFDSQFCRMNCQIFSWPLSSGACGGSRKSEMLLGTLRALAWLFNALNRGRSDARGRYVLSLPAAFLGDVKILVGANAQHGDWHRHVARARENDDVFQSRARKLRRHQRHRGDVSSEGIIGPRFK